MSTSTNARKAQVVAARALRAAADRLAPASGKVEFSLRHPRAHAVYEKLHRFPEELTHVASTVRTFPDTFQRVRFRGRQKAEQYRASRVWPALVRDLFRDVAARGTHRSAAG